MCSSDLLPAAAVQISAGLAAESGADYWLVHLGRDDAALASALARYAPAIVPVARFGAPDGPGVVVLRAAR